jgi:hypothetical protein
MSGRRNKNYDRDDDQNNNNNVLFVSPFLFFWLGWKKINRLQMLEESLRDVELRATQQLSEEQRRNKELIVRVEREKQLEIENCTIK